MALARAVYARTKYVLLDDPLSAVVSRYYPLLRAPLTPESLSFPFLQDSHTSRVLYENLLRGPLLANRTVVRRPLITPLYPSMADCLVQGLG